MEMKDLVISEPEGQTWPLTQNDDLLILASDGLYRSYSQEYVIKRILELRAQNIPLGQASEIILEECIRLEQVKKPCQDNLTLIIVSLSDYLNDFEQQMTQKQLALCKQTQKGVTEESSFKIKENFADVTHSGEPSALSESGLCSSGDAQSQISSVGHFYGGSLPSSTNSSPQQFINPKSENLANHQTTDADMDE